MAVIEISPPVLEWAQRRSGRAPDELRSKFADWDQWLSRQEQPSFAEVEAIAEFTRVPVGYFFLPEPPVEELPIPDFRIGRGGHTTASADLLDTIYQNQRRQAWYEDYVAEFGGSAPLEFVGSAAGMAASDAAELMIHALDYGVARRARWGSVDEARAHLISQFEELGGLVVLNSMVGNNTHRMLDLSEFRGFTLHSRTAPLVFVNGRDTKRGQVFSLLHEFAHVWRGESGVSAGGDPLVDRSTEAERWCDAVAAEIAVPSDDLRRSFEPNRALTEELDRLAGRYRCSTLVILLKLRQINLVAREGFQGRYDDEVRRLLDILEGQPSGGGGDFYNNQPFRVGQTLSRAIIRDARFGATSMTEALRLLGFKSIPMFDKYANRLGEP